jgi:hypothetical protein
MPSARYANASRLRRETLPQRWTHILRLYMSKEIYFLTGENTATKYELDQVWFLVSLNRAIRTWISHAK